MKKQLSKNKKQMIEYLKKKEFCIHINYTSQPHKFVNAHNIEQQPEDVIKFCYNSLKK